MVLSDFPERFKSIQKANYVLDCERERDFFKFDFVSSSLSLGFSSEGGRRVAMIRRRLGHPGFTTSSAPLILLLSKQLPFICAQLEARFSERSFGLKANITLLLSP